MRRRHAGSRSDASALSVMVCRMRRLQIRSGRTRKRPASDQRKITCGDIKALTARAEATAIDGPEAPHYGCVVTSSVSRRIRSWYGTEPPRGDTLTPRVMVENWDINEVVLQHRRPLPVGRFGPASRSLETPYLDYPLCKSDLTWKTYRPSWKTCIHHNPEIVTPHGIPDTYIIDWSKDRDLPLRRSPPPSGYGPYDHNNSAPGGLLSLGRMRHPDLWKIVAAMRDVKTNSPLFPGFPTGPLTFQIRACLSPPFLFVVGDGSVVPEAKANRTLYKITCEECYLTNCLPLPSAPNPTKKVFLAMQPPYLMMPVEVRGPWYRDYGYQFAQELEGLLSRGRRFLGLLIAGITALVSLIASATVSTVALSQGIHTAAHVNSLAHNVSQTLATQGSMDRKILARLDGLEQAVEYLGTQYSLLHTRLSFVCHGGYGSICVTPLEADNVSWETVQRHLQGIWHETNVSLDLFQLQEQINNIASSHLHVVTPRDMAQSFLQKLQGFNPFNILQHSFWIMCALVVGVTLLLCLWCAWSRCLFAFMASTQANVHMLHLKIKGGNVGSHEQQRG
ncbi:endogenous retrovirus group K member 13-1 Env polyprotein-like isoform X2 [Zalophus californianus]|uniref:Endogenous retrovirus group K member 13-1 Env polyprotein-like isoform X2 n=1 Tax=Zalophus californianus TaxID=9704 RepID=A0A6P9F8F7_ZALCA|nr:endogenous retrovirus group K member 13-1 Env polyprotein-like isoform X2 [Zalophus californianus]